MKKIAIVYHSGQGHTEHIAQRIYEGASSIADTEVQLLEAARITSDPTVLLGFDGIVLGSPTYLGGVSGPFKHFMDATGRMWREQKLKGKVAAGFTVSALPAGDKQSTLLSMFVFAMQHGMIWIGNPIMPEQHLGIPGEHAANRLGSWSGLMAQADHAPPAQAFVPGDLKTACRFGRNFALALSRIVTPAEATAQEALQ